MWSIKCIHLVCSQTQFRGWRNKSSVMKAQAGELEEAMEAVVLDIKQLGELVSKSVIFHLLHTNHLRKAKCYLLLEIHYASFLTICIAVIIRFKLLHYTDASMQYFVNQILYILYTAGIP